VDALFQWVSTHDGHPLACVPTGGGKSLIMGTLVHEALSNAPAARALILAHRKELIQQNVRAVASVMPLGQIGVYSAGLKSRDRTSPIIVAGIQSRPAAARAGRVRSHSDRRGAPGADRG
jgi:DNA repair protein RadD